MQKFMFLVAGFVIALSTYGQKLETVYLNPKDSTSDMYIAVLPERSPAKAFMVLLDGFGASPKDVLVQTDLPLYAAGKGILTILPVLKTGSLYLGIDNASQQSLKELVSSVANRFHLQGKDFYIGGFSIGGSCAVKYAELAVRDKYEMRPRAVFAVDPPLDFERFYNAAKRIVVFPAIGL